MLNAKTYNKYVGAQNTHNFSCRIIAAIDTLKQDYWTHWAIIITRCFMMAWHFCTIFSGIFGKGGSPLRQFFIIPCISFNNLNIIMRYEWSSHANYNVLHIIQQASIHRYAHIILYRQRNHLNTGNLAFLVNDLQ